MPAAEDISPARRWLRPALWTALFRHLVPVVGVLALGWHPLDVLVFLFVETWLFLTLRMAAEGVLNRRFGDVPTTVVGAVAQLALFVPVLAVVFGFVMGLVGLVVQQLAFGADDWRAFLETAAWRTPLYRIALALVAVEQVGEAVVFALRLARTSGPEIADDLHLQRMVQRVVFLAAAGLVAGFAPAAGARGVVVALAAAMFLWEAWPDEAAPPAEATRPADAAAAAPRTKRPRRARSRRG